MVHQQCPAILHASLLQPTQTTLIKGTLDFVLQKDTKEGKEAVSYKTLNQRHQDLGASKEHPVIYASLLRPQINHSSCGFINYGLFTVRMRFMLTYF
jgi:hypothetical protein